MQIDPRAFLAAVIARTRLLPDVKLVVIGDPVRAADLRFTMFGHDRHRFVDAPGGLAWSFDGSAGILVDSVPHAQIAAASVAALARDPQDQLQFASLQKVSAAIRHQVARAAVEAVAGIAELDVAHRLVDALAQVAIAFGLRPDTADHAASERLRDLEHLVEPVLHTVPAPVDRAAFVAIGHAFAATCATAPANPLAHFANAVAAATTEN